MTINKYSDWLKIDLHIHTDKSRQTKHNDYKGNFSVGTLHEKLTENDVQIFSLTDHNIINVDAYREYYRNHSDPEDPLLLVGVELDIEVEHNGGSRLYHSLLIFDCQTADEAESINSRLDAKYTERGLENYDRKLTIDDVIEIFHDDKFFFIPHADGHRNIVSAYLDVGIEGAQKMVLLMPSALEKVTDGERRRVYSAGFSQSLTDSFRSRDDIPYIEFSDNHRIEQYPIQHMGGDEKENHEFYHVKGSKNYETIRLAFIDPRSRIKSPQEYEQIDRVSNKLEKLKVLNEPKIEDVEIFFSPHLNVIIGGRSSGKSLLMNILGSKIDKVEIVSHYTVDDHNFLIKSKDDGEYKVKTSIGDSLIYINQGDIVRYFEQDDLESLAKKSEKQIEYSNAKAEIISHKGKLECLLEDLVNDYGDVLDLGRQTKYELHQSSINSIFGEEFTLDFDEESLKEQYIFSDKITEAKSLVDLLSEKTKEFRDNEILGLAGNEKALVNSFLNLLEAKEKLIQAKDNIDARRSAFITQVKNLVNERNGDLSQGAREKSRAKEMVVELKKEVKNKFEKAARLKRSSDAANNFDYEIKKAIEVSDDVSLVLSVEKKKEIREVILAGGINDAENNKSLYINLLGLFNETKTIKNLNDNSKEKLDQKINTVLASIYGDFDNPKDYLKYDDDTTSAENSPGLNSENYLKVVLKNSSSKMIFIDQPEDNLGNKFISHELVDIIREIKFQKQIFLVTHNPAVAVYGDAECIVIAENNDNKISYKQIVLEDKDAQKEICSILDGGEYIFDNRSRKYNIQRILMEAQNG